MILVTGATGNIGSVLLRRLHDGGTRSVRGLTRDAARAAFPQSVEAVEGDLTRPETLKAALHGVRSLVLVPYAGGEREVVAAAERAGVEHVVLVSSVVVETHPRLPASREKAAIEQAVRDSEMAWTILRPTQFASNVLWWAESIRTEGAVSVPYPDVGLPVVHPADIADVAYAALTEPGHRGRTYSLTGPERITPRQQVAAIAAAAGRDITVVGISRAQAHEQLAEFLGGETADAVLDLTGGDVTAALARVRDTVGEVTGHPATPFARWAQEHAAAFR
ncbi:NAD(P)H-binding protein [Streptomyces zagrosensis]|nr:NAD(P)H-binding protein [Streptomyces zagrosensis]